MMPGRLRLAVLVLALCGMATARPLVRNVRTDDEFRRLLKHHAEVTGLPVIIDFYSDGCGPCRQVAPIYKQLAEQYKDKAVFAKVDINANYQTASAQQIRSMPTFQLYLFGKKRDQFSGADVQRIQNQLASLVRESEMKNIEVTFDALKAFYQEHAPEKMMEMDDKKLQDILDKAGKGGGPGHYALVKALKTKYKGKAPKTQKRAVAAGAGNDDAKKAGPPPSTRSKSSGGAEKPNLHLAKMEDLEKEIARRKEEEAKKKEEEGGDDDEDESPFPIYIKDNRTATENMVIIGSGPAGLAAAIYASRAGLNPVIAAPPMGGQLQGKGVGVENYPGINESTGPNMVHGMQLQAARFGAVFHQDIVLSVDTKTRPFTVRTNETDIKTHSVVVATGADSRWLGVEGEWEMRGGGVSSCATCDGYLFADQDVVVIGGGDTAMEDALVLARTSKSVTVIHRRDKFRASKVLAGRVLSHPKISVRWDSEVVAFEGKRQRVLPSGIAVEIDADGKILEEDMSKLRVKEVQKRLDAAGISYAGIKDKEQLVATYKKAVADALKDQQGPNDADEGSAAQVEERTILTRVKVANSKTKEESVINCGAAFVAIGHDPNTKFVKGQIDMDANGYIAVKAGSTRTSVEGVFAAGDVADHVYRQAITSAGSGAMAALDAERWLSEQGFCSN